MNSISVLCDHYSKEAAIARAKLQQANEKIVEQLNIIASLKATIELFKIDNNSSARYELTRAILRIDAQKVTIKSLRSRLETALQETRVVRRHAAFDATKQEALNSKHTQNRQFLLHLVNKIDEQLG